MSCNFPVLDDFLKIADMLFDLVYNLIIKTKLSFTVLFLKYRFNHGLRRCNEESKN